MSRPSGSIALSKDPRQQPNFLSAKTNRAAAVGIGRIPNSGLAHCVFDVTDVEKAEDFYVKALGVDPQG